jgi:5-methylcytosine-specific restriction endonuclease McrA
MKLSVVKYKNYGCTMTGGEDTDDYEVDHIIPYSKGGKTELSNAQLVLIYFNRAKNNNEKYI